MARLVVRPGEDKRTHLVYLGATAIGMLEKVDHGEWATAANGESWTSPDRQFLLDWLLRMHRETPLDRIKKRLTKTVWDE